MQTLPDPDSYWMTQALQLAHHAAQHGEVPVGALVVQDGKFLASAFNQPIAHSDPTAHAEVLALRRAATIVDNYRLPGTTLYVTLEPCIMCAGAIVHARVKRVVFGAYDPKSGAAGSVVSLLQHAALNHQCIVRGGVLQQQSADLLRSFFQQKRRKSALN